MLSTTAEWLNSLSNNTNQVFDQTATLLNKFDIHFSAYADITAEKSQATCLSILISVY